MPILTVCPEYTRETESAGHAGFLELRTSWEEDLGSGGSNQSNVPACVHVPPAGEEERELDRVSVCGATFEALLRGYRCAWGQLLTPAEVDLLPDAGKLITYEQALRFLSDYLQGDVYYRISYPDQNLQRARNQLHLARLLDQL